MVKKGIYYNQESIKIEHYCPTKDIRWNEISGNYFAPEGEGDLGFGMYKHEYYIKPDTKIYKHYSSRSFLKDKGYYYKFNSRIKRKYNHFAESWNNNTRNTSDGVAKIESYHDLYLWASLTDDPNLCYLESQLAAVKMIKREYNPQVVYFASEDDLNPEQYIILDKNCLEKISHKLVAEDRFIKTFEEHKTFYTKK